MRKEVATISQYAKAKSVRGQLK